MPFAADSSSERGPLKPRVTMRDVAEAVGVSHVTVSLALRNHPSISKGRRDEVLAAAARLGYHPDPLLSSLVVYRKGTRAVRIQSALAWINHWEQPKKLREHGEFDGYWRGAFRAAERFGYRLEEIQWTPDCSAKRFEQILLTRNVRGVLVPPHPVQPDWGAFDWSLFSVIRFGLSVRTPDSHLVTADQLRAVTMAMEQIHRRGYERIGMVVGKDFDRKLGGNYIGGYRAAQELLGLKSVLPPLLTDQADYAAQPAAARTALRKWMTKHRPDAVLAAVPAIPGMLRELGYKIPQDVAVAGTSILDVAVAAGIDQNPEEIGRIAVEMLVAQIDVNQCGQPLAPCRILVESRWRDGSSLPDRSKSD